MKYSNILLIAFTYLWQQTVIHQINISDTFYFTSRYYDPKLSRMIQSDTQTPGGLYNPQGRNRYTYVFNNSLKYHDPSGHIPVQAQQNTRSYIPTRIGVPNVPHGVDPDKSIIGNGDQSRPLIHSGIVIVPTDIDHTAETIIAAMQSTLGDQATIIGFPLRGEKVVVTNPNNGTRTERDIYVLGMQEAIEPKPESASYHLAMETKRFFEMTQDPKYHINAHHMVNLFLGDSSKDPFYATLGGGARTIGFTRTYRSMSAGEITTTRKVAASIFFDLNRQNVTDSQGNPIPNSFGTKIFHELIGHMSQDLKSTNPANPHNNLIQDLKGIYDPGHRIDNDLIIPAHNQNNQDNPIPNRTQHRYPFTPNLRKFLFHDIIFGQTKPEEKKE